MQHAPVQRRDAEPRREVSAAASRFPEAKGGSQSEPCASRPAGKGIGWSKGWSILQTPRLDQGLLLHPSNALCCTRDSPQFIPSNIPVGPGTHLLHSSNASAGAGILHPPITPCLTWDPSTPDPKISHAGCLTPSNTLQWTRNPHPPFIPRNLGAFRGFRVREQRGRGTAKRRAVTLLKGTEALCHRGLKYVESKICWPRSQGGDRNLAEDPGEQSKNRKMHRQA